MEETTVIERKTPSYPLRVSSPEATALELVGYADQSAGLDNVATVLAELAPSLQARRLGVEAARSPDHRRLADHLAVHVGKRVEVTAPLVRSSSTAGAALDKRWHLAVNTDVDPDV